jgi:1A family penicillin-binding protein
LDKIIFPALHIFAAVVIFLVIIYSSLNSDLPRLPDNLSEISSRLPTEIYSSDGKLLRVLGQRQHVKLENISPYFQKAIIAVEDSKFYNHRGVDHLSLIRATMVNIKNGRVVQGASTITQQLSKNLFFNFEKLWTRKIKELLLAFQIESSHSKDEILEAYCSQVYFGRGLYGIAAASQYYFGVNPRNLTLMQAAILAGIPKSPNANNPITSLDRSRGRAKHVLNRMVKENFISPSEKLAALESKIYLSTPKKKSDINGYFTDHIVSHLEKKYGKEFLHFGGLKIVTTLNAGMQKSAYDSASEHMKFLKGKLKENKNEDLQTALVCIENESGAVRAMIGGVNYARSQFNRATSHNRMPGSSFKPFVYFTAMQNLGYHPATSIIDEPIVMDIPGTKTWRPKNYGNKYYGPVILKDALAKSLNIIAIKMVYQLTPKKVLQTAREFGITAPLKANYSIALGASGVSPLQMTSAYSVIANMGYKKDSHMISNIDDFQGNRLFEHISVSDKRFSADSVYPLLDMMQGVVENGSGKIVRRMGFKFPAGGKTGTTNDHKDAWFTGFTKHFTSSVWVGYDSNKSLIRKNNLGLTGSQGAAPVWSLFMKNIHKGLDDSDFKIPEGIKIKTVDKSTGQLATEGSKNSLRVALKDEEISSLTDQDILENDVSQHLELNSF